MKALKQSALFIALSAAAFAANAGPVDIYGTADIGYTYTKVGADTVHTLNSSGARDSFIGFKASEDLGNGIKAFVTLEHGFDLDSGTDANLKRETSVGLTNGVHTLKAGRLQSLARNSVKEFDVFGGGNIGMARGIAAVQEYYENSAEYSVVQGDFRASVQHSFGEVVGGGLGDGSVNAFSIGYGRGPLTASVVHTDVDNGPAVTQLAGAFDFGVAKTSVIYQDAKDSVLDNSFLVGVKAPVAGFVAQASVGQAKLVSGDKVDLYSIGGGYSLSKRTNLYAAYGRIEALSDKGEQFTIGMNHSF
jgi:predicted porin